MTLYTFAFDDEGESTCYGTCAQMWMPLTTPAGMTPSTGEGVLGEVGTVERTDGQVQVTYNGAPLYYYFEDEAPGDAKGQGAEDVWFAANPATVMLNQDGTHLVGPGGLTLYLFTADEGSESYCFEECTVAWPPLIVMSGMQPLLGSGITGELGLTPRPDGTMQVTFNGIPVYFFRGDAKPGDTNGDGLKDVWYVVTPDANPTESTEDEDGDEDGDEATEEPADDEDSTEETEEPVATEES
jgi:predicted lipoprotein with Yx(FWY)xxD motif